MISFGPSRATRRPSLTPMIDVVFLLLVFFMLAARFGHDLSLPMATGGGAVAYDGPPRLVAITEGGVALNGRALPLDALAGALTPLMETPEDIVVLRPAEGVSLQQLIEVSDALRAAGVMRLVVVD
ncbi:ExbD/TolR family protein [Roseovarius autotrophicus]|uniref:ExbD/TolR family protein n=1 Tax=Roseovarius autotrophicus TaxID=2824121 RepID=UPI001A033725|nr:biopolymer transporter ExbD [Roseovarius autotrophicus]MBE0454061.1 biopolymer transporter ExbD [Roseovarius sp.]